MSREVVAKMRCNAIETSRFSETSKQHKVHMGAVYGNQGENASFTKATPAGALWMNIDDSAPALDFFKPGKSYYVTFTEAPD